MAQMVLDHLSSDERRKLQAEEIADKERMKMLMEEDEEGYANGSHCTESRSTFTSILRHLRTVSY